MSDSELIYSVTQNAGGLTPEALEIAKNEIIKRGLNPGLSKALDVQNKTYTVEELHVYCNLVNSLSCPICHKKGDRLNGTLTAEVMSFIILTRYKKKIHIGCPNCLDKLNNAALTKTIVFGWWGFPWGIIRSVQAIITNIKSKRTHHLDTSNQFLMSFVLSNIGQLEAYKGDKNRLGEVIATVLE
jgi:predicted nucleic-acid-binding Zn-ribbon protein